MTFFGGRITEGRALTPTGSRDADMTEAGRLLDAYAARGRADGAPKLEDALSVLLSRSIRRLESRIARQPLPAPVTERVVSLRGARAFASTRLYLHLAHARHMVGAFSRDPAGGDISLYVYGANAQSHEAEFMFRHLQAAMYEFAHLEYEKNRHGITSFRRYMRHYATGFGGEIARRTRRIETRLIVQSSIAPALQSRFEADERRAIAGLRSRWPRAAERWYHIEQNALIETTTDGATGVGD